MKKKTHGIKEVNSLSSIMNIGFSHDTNKYIFNDMSSNSFDFNKTQ